MFIFKKKDSQIKIAHWQNVGRKVNENVSIN